MKDTRAKSAIKLAGLKRHFMWMFLSNPLKLILVTEFPKSGASWMAQMLARYYELPFRRNESARFEKSIMHGHYLVRPSFKAPVAVLRDGRDVMVSYYFHMLIGNDRLPSFSVKDARKNFDFKDYNDIKTNLPKFIEYMYEQYPKRMGFMYFSWSQFVQSAMQENVIQVKYEDMKKDSGAELIRVVKRLSNDQPDPARVQEIVDEFSFEKQSGRKAGSENKKSYLRKGVVGDWKNHFSTEACEIFDKYAGKELVLLDYEQNRNWFK